MEILIVFLPLLAAIISGFFGNKLGNRFSEILTSLFVSISAIFFNQYFLQCDDQ